MSLRKLVLGSVVFFFFELEEKEDESFSTGIVPLKLVDPNEGSLAGLNGATPPEVLLERVFWTRRCNFHKGRVATLQG